MHFEPFPVLPGRSAIDVYDSDGRKVGTIYGVSGGLHLVLEDGYTLDGPESLVLEVQWPFGLLIGIRRERRE